MKIIFLGTGTSTGVPVLGCKCKVCHSVNPKDIRLRSSVQVEVNDTNILIDCTPDFRQQMLNRPFRKIDGIVVTHEHFDHVGGFEDLRPYSPLGAINIYAEENVKNAIINRMPYCFKEHRYGGVPEMQIHLINNLDPFRIGNVEVIPIRVMHHNLPILGFRIGKFAYLTDVKRLPDEELKKLSGLDVLVLSALRIEKHISHQSLHEAIELSNTINAKQTFFTHMSHQIGFHQDVCDYLEPNMSLAYDRLELFCR